MAEPMTNNAARKGHETIARKGLKKPKPDKRHASKDIRNRKAGNGAR